MARQGEAVGRKYVGKSLVLVAVATLAVLWTVLPERAESGSPPLAKSGIQQVYRLGLGPGDLLLESIREFIKDQGIRDGAVLTGIGSLSECRLHWPVKAEYPPTDKFGTFKGALEVTGIQGIIADGEPHLHMMVAEGGDARAAGGHMEEGCKVLYLVELTIAEFDGPPMTRRPNEHGVNMLQKK